MFTHPQCQSITVLWILHSLQNNLFLTKNLHHGEKIGENKNIWAVLHPISTLSHKHKQPQTPKPKELQTPSSELTMIIN